MTADYLRHVKSCQTCAAYRLGLDPNAVARCDEGQRLFDAWAEAQPPWTGGISTRTKNGRRK